ncbi:hypothetical protein CXP43_10920 [Bacillus velezensis]|nr:hypothetical protein CXP43_10920 [Bacillus velezensis]QDP90508.1 hypothetical protein FGF55_10160 [Bacillus amyloliquefaciens]
MRIVDVLLNRGIGEAAVFYGENKKLTFRKKYRFLETFSFAEPYYFITAAPFAKGFFDERSKNVICS